MNDWQETLLWKEIGGRSPTSRVHTALSVLMPVVQETLRAGLPASPDFTLHDNEHGFRVAQLGAKLVGGEQIKLLSDAEIALLLLASYCHDIGMSPNRDKVRRHLNFLISGENEILNPSEERELQAWLDENWNGLTAPVERDFITAAGLLLAEEVNAYYCRSRHNDWSEDWIRTHLGSRQQTIYPNWIDDLVTLCRSHHEGLSQLRQPRFDARLVGSPASTVNIRYLAAVLRVADIMEFAPERTPDVILAHRSIAPKSRIYWYKDHSISFSLDNINNKLFFSALSPSAVVHRAVLMTAQGVNDELAICSTLDQEGAFRQGTIPDDSRERYTWPWPARLTTDIREKDGAFVYIDGAFRPDTKRILDLLSGTELYGEPLVGLRELAQNALDAVKEQIAYERLQSREPGAADIEEALSKLHSVAISFYEDEEGHWITCADNGSGMTKSIIENSLLVSGAAIRGDIRALERDAEAAGFSLGRTGQFGIGVLSYFMLADRLKIATRRSLQAGDTDGVGWRFVTEGLGGFGELREDSRGSPGTEVSLRIRPAIVGKEPGVWWQTVLDYLSDVLRWTPCQVELRDDTGWHSPRQLGPGWTTTPTQLTKTIAARIIDTGPEFIDIPTAAQEARARAARSRKTTLATQAERSIRWHDPQQFSCTNPLSSGRVWLPYFELSGGPCLVFLSLDEQFKSRTEDDATGYLPPPSKYLSWQGIFVESTDAPHRCFTEVDYRGGRSISIDRHSFIEEDEENETVLVSTEDALQRSYLSFLSGHGISVFHDLNVAYSPVPLLAKSRFAREHPVWSVRERTGGTWQWREVPFPLVDAARLSFHLSERRLLKYKGRPVHEGGWIGRLYSDYGIRLMDIYGGGNLVHYDMDSSYRGFVGILWNSLSEMVPLDGTQSAACANFPPVWDAVATVSTPKRLILNNKHPLLKLLPERLPECAETFDVDAVKIGIEFAVSSPSDAAAFIVQHAFISQRIWIYLRENYCDLFREVLRLVGVVESNQLLLVSAQSVGQAGGAVDLYDAGFSAGPPAICERLPSTGTEWEIAMVGR